MSSDVSMLLNHLNIFFKAFLAEIIWNWLKVIKILGNFL